MRRILWGIALQGCVRLETVDEEPATVDSTGLVTIDFRATIAGEGYPDLTKDDFLVTEDGALVSTFESDFDILPRPERYDIDTVLLLGLSGSVIGSDSLGDLISGATTFVGRLPTWSSVAVSWFDGRHDLHPLFDFTKDHDAAQGALRTLETVCADGGCDPSTNLNEAITMGLDILDDRAAKSPLRYSGSLVVFNDGTDRARRVDEADARWRVRHSEHAVYGIGVGGEIQKRYLAAIGKSGSSFAPDFSQVESTFRRVAADIARDANSLYPLRYCTPARSGEHEIRIRKGRFGGIFASFDASRIDAPEDCAIDSPIFEESDAPSPSDSGVP